MFPLAKQCSDYSGFQYLNLEHCSCREQPHWIVRHHHQIVLAILQFQISASILFYINYVGMLAPLAWLLSIKIHCVSHSLSIWLLKLYWVTICFADLHLPNHCWVLNKSIISWRVSPAGMYLFSPFLNHCWLSNKLIIVSLRVPAVGLHLLSPLLDHQHWVSNNSLVSLGLSPVGLHLSSLLRDHCWVSNKPVISPRVPPPLSISSKEIGTRHNINVRWDNNNTTNREVLKLWFTMKLQGLVWDPNKNLWYN